MNNFENLQLNAQRRRQKKEQSGEMSISHWRSELHAHTKDDISDPDLPSDIIKNRKGSNCGTIPLEVLARYHSKEMMNDILAVTEHSRDPSPEPAIEKVTGWFKAMYLNNEEWLKEKFSKNKSELSDHELKEIELMALEDAKRLVLYGDERMERMLGDIDTLDKKDTGEMRILKGVEASLMPDGNLDTKLVEQKRFEWVNCSIHPKIDPMGFKEIINDPGKYTELVLKGINNPNINNFSHIGHDCRDGFTEELDWDKIAEAAIKNKVAIEINLRNLMNFIYEELLNFDKYPKNNKIYPEVLKEKLPRLIPIISSPQISGKLSRYFSAGLKIALNTDEHRNNFILTRRTKEAFTAVYLQREFRFWRCLKEVEKYFNELFKNCNVKSKNIINTFSKEEIEEFRTKK